MNTLTQNTRERKAGDFYAARAAGLQALADDLDVGLAQARGLLDRFIAQLDLPVGLALGIEKRYRGARWDRIQHPDRTARQLCDLHVIRHLLSQRDRRSYVLSAAPRPLSHWHLIDVDFHTDVRTMNPDGSARVERAEDRWAGREPYLVWKARRVLTLVEQQLGVRPIVLDSRRGFHLGFRTDRPVDVAAVRARILGDCYRVDGRFRLPLGHGGGLLDPETFLPIESELLEQLEAFHAAWERVVVSADRFATTVKTAESRPKARNARPAAAPPQPRTAGLPVAGGESVGPPTGHPAAAVDLLGEMGIAGDTFRGVYEQVEAEGFDLGQRDYQLYRWVQHQRVGGATELEVCRRFHHLALRMDHGSKDLAPWRVNRGMGQCYQAIHRIFEKQWIVRPAGVPAPTAHIFRPYRGTADDPVEIPTWVREQKEELIREGEGMLGPDALEGSRWVAGAIARAYGEGRDHFDAVMNCQVLVQMVGTRAYGKVKRDLVARGFLVESVRFQKGRKSTQYKVNAESYKSRLGLENQSGKATRSEMVCAPPAVPPVLTVLFFSSAPVQEVPVNRATPLLC